MPVDVYVYTGSNCPYCARAKSLLERKGIPYTEVNLDGREEELNALRARTGWRTIPQIFIGDKMIGGYEDLANLESKGDLDRMVKN